MRIDKLELTNFKNFSHLKAEFTPRVNLFVGVNGSGKTALLDAVCVALGGFFSSSIVGMNRVPERHEIKISNGEREPYVTVSAEGKGIKKKWSRTTRVIGGNKIGTDSKHVAAAKSYGEHFFNDAFWNKEDRTIAPLISYHSTQRLFKVASKSKYKTYDPHIGRFNGYLECLENHSIFSEIIDWFWKSTTDRSTELQKGIEVKKDLVLENVEAALTEALIRGGAVKQDCKPTIYYSTKLMEAMLDIADEKPLPISYYSDGYRNFIFLVMDIVWRASQLNPWLTYEELKEKSFGVVVIDEIDLHLHPKWQGRVIPILQALLPNVQFFITTHSPTVVANFSHGSLYIIEGDEVRICNDKYFGKEVNDVLKNVLGATVRHAETQVKLDKLFQLIDEESGDEALTTLLAELKALLGKEDGEIVRAEALMAWNTYKKEHPDAVH